MPYFLPTSGWRAQSFRKVLWTIWKWFHLLTLSHHSNNLYIIMRSISHRRVISWSCSQAKTRGSFLRWPKKTNNWSPSPCLIIIELIVKNHLKIITPSSSHLCPWVLYTMSCKIVSKSRKGSSQRIIFRPPQVFLPIITICGCHRRKKTRYWSTKTESCLRDRSRSWRARESTSLTTVLWVICCHTPSLLRFCSHLMEESHRSSKP